MGQTVLTVLVIIGVIVLIALAALLAVEEASNKFNTIEHTSNLITPIPQLILSNRPKYFMKHIETHETVAVYDIDKGDYTTTMLIYKPKTEDYKGYWVWVDIQLYEPVD